MTPAAIETQYKKLNNQITKAVQKLNDFCESVSDICQHPENLVVRGEQRCDDGYGRWYKVKTAKCLVCDKYENPWKSGDWSEEYR